MLSNGAMGAALISIPVTNSRLAGMVRPRASLIPASVSWSVMAMAPNPSSCAIVRISEGVEVPSEAVE